MRHRIGCDKRCAKLRGVIGGLLVLLALKVGATAPSAPPLPLAVTRATAPLLRGIWQAEGYNTAFSVDGTRWVQYELTGVSRLEVGQSSADAFFSKFDRILRWPDGRLTFYRRGGITLYTYRLRRALPTRPIEGRAGELADPAKNYRVFVQALSENHAFFERPHVSVDWPVIAERFRVTPKASEGELQSSLRALVEPLKDPHVRVEMDGRGVLRSVPVAARPFIAAWAQWRGVAVTGSDEDLAGPRFRAWVVDHIATRILKNRGHAALQGQLLWGTLDADTAYVAPLAFDALIPEATTHAETDISAEIAALRTAMPQVLAAVAGCKAMVIDLRFNGGGHDGVALAFAGYFAHAPALAFYKFAQSNGTSTAAQPILVSPQGAESFAGPVAVLTSSSTGSGAEIALFGLRAGGPVQLIGQRSAGALSDALPVHLPNGWTATVSNEIYLGADGTSYEGLGIPVDIETPIVVDGDFEAGLDHTLQVGIDAVRSARPAP